MTGEHIDKLMGESSNAASLDRLLELFERGDFDLVAVGRGMLVNADWVNRFRDGWMDQLKNWDPDVLQTLV
jgi:2,4-dienoyl-CoA reductase-like NADH-dependent reductase (Old Yellow Enzyme family)